MIQGLDVDAVVAIYCKSQKQRNGVSITVYASWVKINVEPTGIFVDYIIFFTRVNKSTCSFFQCRDLESSSVSCGIPRTLKPTFPRMKCFRKFILIDSFIGHKIFRVKVYTF